MYDKLSNQNKLLSLLVNIVVNRTVSAVTGSKKEKEHRIRYLKRKREYERF